MATQASDSIKQRPRTTTADELAVVAQRAQAFTNASGAAIAIGNSEELVCRARSGSSAPEVGTAMRVEGSFTGLCIQTGKELRCDDAETDTRVDTAALRSLGIRSLVVTPIKDEGKVIGVLAVFAPTPHAFTITHVAVLKTMADQIANLLQKERRGSREESHTEAPAPPPKIAPTPLPPVVIKPAGASSAAVAAAPARTNGSGAPVIETLKPVAIATEIAPVPFPKREEKRESKRHEPKPEAVTVSAPKSNLTVLDAVAGESQHSKSGKFVLIGGVAVLVVAAVVVWKFVGARKGNSSASQQPAQQTQSTTAAQPTGAVAPSPTATTTTTTPTPTTPVATSNAKSNAPEKPDSKKSDSQKNDRQSKPASAPTTVELASGPSKISGASAAEQSPDVAPSLTVGSSAAPSLTSLAKPVGNTVPSVLTQSELVNAKAIRAVPASYPEIAKARRISGTVVVRVTVSKEGKVSNPKFISGPMVFRDAAFDAVKQWLFKPATLNGQPIEQETEITVKFNPS